MGAIGSDRWRRDPIANRSHNAPPRSPRHPRRRGGGAQPAAAPPKFLERYVFVAALYRLWNRVARQYIEVHAAILLHAHEVGGAGEAKYELFTGPNAVDKVDGVSLLPNQPEIVESERGGRKLNLWTPTPLIAVLGDVGPFLEHLG